MENDNQQNNKAGNHQNNSSKGASSGTGGSIGSAGSKGTQAYNNGNENAAGSGRGNEESGAFADENEGGYEGGNLGTAGSGSMDIPVTASSAEHADPFTSSDNASDNSPHTDKPVVPVPIEQDEYEGGNMGTAGSGGMDIHGSESSLSVDALEADKDEKPQGSKNPHGLGSPPAANIADGGQGGARQPKEHTGKDTEMGGATGGTQGLGNGNENSDQQDGGSKSGSGSASGGGGSSPDSKG